VGESTCIKIDQKEIRGEMAELIQLTRCRWWSVLNTKMNLRAQQKAGNCFTIFIKENSGLGERYARLNELRISMEEVALKLGNLVNP
jgi:hypothetical protein